MQNTKIATILIPNFKTYKLTKVCLRLIRKFTDLNKVEVIVIDNNSNDESLEYLKKLNWIKLIERKGIFNESGPMSHAKALDLGLKKVKTQFVISFHTDTFVTKEDWLNFVLMPFSDKEVAGVGSWKLEKKNLFKTFGKKIEFLYKKIIGSDINHQRFNKDYHYLRSHFAIYRMSAIKKTKSFFSDGEESAGKILHKKLINNGFKMVFLKTEELIKYVEHVNHATQALNKQFNIRSAHKVLKSYLNFMNKKIIRDVLNDSSLDD